MTDRFPHDTTLDGPDEPCEPKPERDPDEARDQLLDDVADGFRDPPAYLRATVRRWPSQAEVYGRTFHENLHNPRG